MHNLIINWYVYPLMLVLFGLLITWIVKLPPKIKPLNPSELSIIREYHGRLSRRGTFTHPDLIVVTGIGKAQERELVSCI